MNKKLVIAISVIAFLTVIGLIIWLSFKNQNRVTVIPAKDLGVAALNPVITSDENILYYDLKEGDIFKLNPQDNSKEQLSENMDEPERLIWSPNRTQVIIKIIYDKYRFEKFGSPFINYSLADETPTLWNYNLETKKYTLLNTNIINPESMNPDNPIWTSDSKHIIYHYLDSANDVSTLNISDPDGSNWESLGNIPKNVYSILKFDQDNKILIYSRINLEPGNSDIIKYSISDGFSEDVILGIDSFKLIDNHRLVYNKDNSTDIFDLNDNSNNPLPLQLISRDVAYDSEGNILFGYYKPSKTQYIYQISLNDLSVIKTINPKIKNSIINNILIGKNTVYFLNDTELFSLNY